MTTISDRSASAPRVRAARATLTPEQARALRAGLGPTLTRDEAARVAGVSRRTIDRWRRDGRLVELIRTGVDVMTSTLRQFVVLDTDSVLAIVTVAPSESEATS